MEERLETDRTIIRNLLQAAQQWERFRKELLTQLRSLEVLENIHSDPRWTEGRDDLFQLQAVSAGFLQRLRAVEYRITTDLIQETDSLIQRVTNLISIDEGYRSRDQNQSIRRLTWITVCLACPKSLLCSTKDSTFHVVYIPSSRVHSGKVSLNEINLASKAEDDRVSLG